MGNGILASYTFRSYHKKTQKPPINICSVASILVIAPYVYIELLVGSSRGELHFWAMGSWLLIHSGAFTKKIPRSTVNICPVASILAIAPYVYIELPVGSSRRELHFWAMGSGLLIHSGAFTKKIPRFMINICSVASILVIAPYVYIELPVGSSRRGLHFWAMGF